MPTTRPVIRRLRAIAANESGQAAVEFALVLPLLVTIILGMVHFGFALNRWIDETHLASSGARYAAVARNPGPEPTLQEYIRAQSSTDGLEEDLVVCINYDKAANAAPGPIRAGDSVSVKVKSTYGLLPVLNAGPEVDIVGSATMRLERAPNLVAAPESPADCLA